MVLRVKTELDYNRRGRQKLPREWVMSTFKDLTQTGVPMKRVFQKQCLGYNCGIQEHKRIHSTGTLRL